MNIALLEETIRIQKSLMKSTSNRFYELVAELDELEATLYKAQSLTQGDPVMSDKQLATKISQAKAKVDKLTVALKEAKDNLANLKAEAKARKQPA